MGVSKVRVRGRQMWRARVKEGGITKNAYRRRRDDAVEAEQQLRAEIARELRPEPARKEAPTFAEHWAEYLSDAAATTNKPSTLEAKRSIYEHHLGGAFGHLKVDAIKVREIDRFKAAKLKTHAAKTVNNLLTVLRNALDVAARWERIESVPRIAWVKTEKPPFRFLDFDEAARLADAASHEPLAHAMIVVALNTGLRLGELLALKWDAVDLKAGRLHVREAVARGIVGTPKSGRAREVPLNDTALAVLKEHRHLRGPLVFCNDDGSMLTKNEAKGPLRRARVRAGIVALGWHDLRHTFASHLTMRGVPLKAVQELLGHATIEMTMRYAHLSPNVTRDAVRALDVGGDTGGDRNAAE
jgi:integrase